MKTRKYYSCNVYHTLIHNPIYVGTNGRGQFARIIINNIIIFEEPYPYTIPIVLPPIHMYYTNTFVKNNGSFSHYDSFIDLNIIINDLSDDIIQL